MAASVSLKAFPWGGAPRSELKSNNCQWQLLNNVKVARASPASARRMREKSKKRPHPPDRHLLLSGEGLGKRIATPVCAISWYDCHWQSWIFQIRCAEHHWFAMARIYKSTSKIYPHPLWNVENLSVDNFTVKIFSTRPVEGCEETHTGLWKKSGCRSKAKWTFPHKLSLILLILP